MDSLQVSGQPSQSSKTSSRSASPCRPRNTSDGHTMFDGNKTSDASSGSRGRQRSPTHRREKSGNIDHDDLPSTPHRSVTVHTEQPTPTPDEYGNDEDITEYYYPSSSFISNGSNSDFGAGIQNSDEPDSSNTSRLETALLHLHNKIERTKDLITDAQTERDENVNEYLKLATNADKQQQQRIKAVFEKKNQKSAHVIAQLQKKLESYNKRVRDLEASGAASQAKQPRTVLRDVGQGLKSVGGNIRDGITGFSGSVMSKPREFAHLIKNKFGSADNIPQMSRGSSGEGSVTGGGAGGSGSAGGSATLPAGAGAAAGGSSRTGSHTHSANKYPSAEGSECSSVTSESVPGYQSGSGNHGESNTGHQQSDVHSLKPIFVELQERREDCERIKEKLERMKNLERDVQCIHGTLQDDRFRCERLEEQINDLTELHQNEVENLKQALADMEEKVQYQIEERLRDIHEMLEHCQTKICKMEHQALQQQQYVSLEGLDNSNARALVVKLINVVLTVLQVVLLLVATAAGITMPFLRTRVRILSTFLLVLSIVFVLKQWPEVRDIGSHMMRRLKETLAVK